MKKWLLFGTDGLSCGKATSFRLVAMMEKSVSERIASKFGMWSARMFFQRYGPTISIRESEWLMSCSMSSPENSWSTDTMTAP